MTAHGVDRSSAAGGTGTALVPLDEQIIDAKGDLIVGTANNTADRLAVGANDRILMADSTQTEGMKWATPAQVRTALDVPTTGEAILDTLIAAKGDLIVGTANDTPAILTVGANGTIPMARSAETTGLAYAAALTKAIYGFTYANNVADATNDIDIAAGGAMDATGAYWITGAALTKRSDAAWVVGTGQGGLDDIGSAGNNDFYIWVIARSDTGVVDYLFSLSSTAPTMPANYDFKRLIGWFKRVGGTIVAFKTYELEGGGLDFAWDAPTLDVNVAAGLTTSRRTDAVKVPLNFSVIANLTVVTFDGASTFSRVMCPDETDAAVAAGSGNIATTVGYTQPAMQLQVRTSATGTVAARSDTATIDTYQVRTSGFRWARRN